MAHAARYPDAVSHLVLIVTAAHGGFIPRAQAIVRERGTPEQQAVCEKLWAGGFRTAEEMRHYYARDGPAVRAIITTRRPRRRAGRAASIRPEPLNRAFGPDGFLRRFDLRPRAGADHRADAGAGRAGTTGSARRSSPRRSRRLIPGSDLRVFERSSHSIRSDEPEAMVDAILGFVVYR